MLLLILRLDDHVQAQDLHTTRLIITKAEYFVLYQAQQ